MRLFGKKKDGPPSFEEQLERQTEAGIIEREAGEGYEAVYGTIPFDTRVLDDEKILEFFTPGTSLFDPIFLPLLPFFSRLLATGKLTNDEVKRLCADLDITVQRCLSLARTRNQFFMVRALGDYARWRITGAAREGFLLRTITEHKKTLRLISERERRKRRLWPW